MKPLSLFLHETLRFVWASCGLQAADNRRLSRQLTKMDVLHGEGVRFIIYLQNAFSGFTNEMLFLSRVGDPRNSFFIYFPVAYNLDKAVGLMVLWVAVMSEWLNLILKWFLRGERPYWWVNESDVWKDVKLSQYSLTCETGPGSPSGHAMVTTSVLYTMMPIIITQFLHFFKTKGSLQGQLINVCLWLAFLVVISLVSLSRIFIATHFPHQVIGGVFGGIVISYVTQKNLDLSKFMSVKKCSLVSFMLIILSLGFYEILSRAIFDPSESIQKAQKWCTDPAFIHVETTPFYALVRDAGAVFGIGLAHWLANNKPLSTQNKSLLLQIIQIILSITLIQSIEIFQPSFSNEMVSYIVGYFKNMALVVIVVFLAPFITDFFIDESDRKPKRK